MKELAICKTKLCKISIRIFENPESTNTKLDDVSIFPIKKVLSDSELQSLDEMIQEKTVKDYEAFTQIFIGNDNLLIEFENIILVSVSTYLKNIGKLIKENILDSMEDLSAKINFIKSHIASVQHKNHFHLHTAPNQTILSFPRYILGEWNSVQIFGPTNQSIYLVPGNDDFISCVCEEKIGCFNQSSVLNHFFNIQKQHQNETVDKQSN